MAFPALRRRFVPRSNLATPRLPPLLRAMRPLQWTKNGVVLSALLFSGHLLDLTRFAQSVAALIAFCLVSSGIYLVNDIRDLPADRLHPRKRTRPIAAGDVSIPLAIRSATLLLLGGASLALLIRPLFAVVVLAYVALMLGYSYGLKRLVILDVFAIAAGFVLRAAGGAVAIDVPISPWLYVSTLLGALFLGFAKRRDELATLGADAAGHRANLDTYSLPLLDQIIAVVAAALVVTYALYTFDAPGVPTTHAMMLTIPFVLYGLFRYLSLVYRHGLGGSPELVLVTDRPLLLCIAGWIAVSVVILYIA